MALRSWLFVPADSEAKLAKAAAAGADALILDLEDSVVPEGRPRARELAAEWLTIFRTQLTEGRKLARWVRINPLDGTDWRADLDAVIAAAPDGIMLPKASGPDAVLHLTAELYELESKHGVPVGSTKIIALVSETAAAALAIPAYAAAALPRLAGLTWGAEDLSAAIGATRKRDAHGAWTDTFRFARTQTLLTAHARGALAIDTLHADFRDLDGLKIAAEAAYADGFSGMLAIHPAQIAAINTAFTPSAAELAEARAIVAAFAAAPAAGALAIEGRMIDRPHLKLARRVLGIED